MAQVDADAAVASLYTIPVRSERSVGPDPPQATTIKTYNPAGAIAVLRSF